MDFLKKHYEKVLLGAVLVGLAVGAALLPWKIASEKVSLEEKSRQLTKPPKPLEPVDLSEATKWQERTAAPMTLDFSKGHKLFNPVLWQKRADGTMIKIAHGDEIGVDAVVVTKISPLYTTFMLDSVRTNEAGARFVIVIHREAAAKPVRRTTGASLNEKNKEGFIIREVKGPPDAPELVIELLDTGERASLSKANPFKREDGYTADLRYPPENRTWSNVRVGTGGPGTPQILIGGEPYIVVAITKNEVVLSARSGKKTTRPYSPGS